jgi:glycosyltransferase involved in cell wall biosynthesis
MKISVITPSYNQGRFIEQTIRSVLQQQNADVEHIVMDGGSTDSTKDILAQFPKLRWVSERDRGQSDAINKGFRAATGGVLAWLNSDDWYEPDVLAEVARYFEDHPECMILYGDIAFADMEGRRFLTYTGDRLNLESMMACPDLVRQPSTFWRKEVVELIGGVDETLHIVMDFDFFLRAGLRWEFHYMPRIISNYRCYEENKSLSMGRRQAREMFKVYRKNHVTLSPQIIRFLTIKYLLSFKFVRQVHGILRKRRRGDRG